MALKLITCNEVICDYHNCAGAILSKIYYSSKWSLAYDVLLDYPSNTIVILGYKLNIIIWCDILLLIEFNIFSI